MYLAIGIALVLLIAAILMGLAVSFMHVLDAGWRKEMEAGNGSV